METILITGGAGFIGSHVCDRLLKTKKIICIDNLNSYYSPKRKIKNIQHNFNNPNFSFLTLDIENKITLEKLFKKNKIDKIVHLAARAGVRPSIQDPLLYNSTNISGTLNLLELAKKYNIKQFIFISSSSIYGNNKKKSFSEIDNVDYPISPYAASKKSCELYCYTYSHLYNLNVTCLRLFTVYGPRGRPDMAPYLFTEAILQGKVIKRYGDGTTKRDYTYIDDIIDGIVKALNKQFKFEIINLGNSKPIELNYFINLIGKLSNKKPKIRTYPIPKGDVKITYANISKAKKLLNWQPKTEIEQGMKKFIEWFKQEK